jgi:hypothetical protein
MILVRRKNFADSMLAGLFLLASVLGLASDCFSRIVDSAFSPASKWPVQGR